MSPPGETETQRGPLLEILSEAIRRSLVLVVVVLPLLALCWQVSQGRAFDRLSLGVYVAAAVLLIACERFLAFNGGWGSAIRGNWTDWTYVAVATLMDKGSFFLCAGVVASLGRWISSGLGIELWPSHWGFFFQLLLALVIADIGAYLRHRLFHWSSFLWRFHRIHHSMPGLYWIRSGYTHPLEQLCILMAIMLPISLLGAGAEVLAGTAFLFGLSGLLQHANVDARSSVLNYVFATPEIHRTHHAADARANRSNYSAFFVVMDLLLGTWCDPARYPAPLRVGLEGVASFPGNFFTHLRMPFQRDADDWIVADERTVAEERTVANDGAVWSAGSPPRVLSDEGT